jgi:ABC-2 type transport system ATP-binding protein
VRLAFAVMVQADADIMLIDEVLAVGDAAFGQKCMDVFYEKRAAGKTIVLVTHDMSTVQSLCHRAMLIHDGEMQYLGDAEETALRYYRQNFAGPLAKDGEAPIAAVPDFNARVVHALLKNEAGERVENVEQGAPIFLDVEIEARRDLTQSKFVIHVLNADGIVVFGFERSLEARQSDRIEAGQRVRLAGSIENRLVAGRYSVDCWIRRDQKGGDMAVQGVRLLDFVVYGTAPRHGIVSMRADVEAVAEPGPAS